MDMFIHASMMSMTKTPEGQLLNASCVGFPPSLRIAMGIHLQDSRGSSASMPSPFCDSPTQVMDTGKHSWTQPFLFVILPHKEWTQQNSVAYADYPPDPHLLCLVGFLLAKSFTKQESLVRHSLAG
eukprot:1157179-Pelagomonas_calceolata.AAC.10